jgi:hypothetical protein
MSSIGFPIFVVTTLLAGTAAAIVLTPKDILRPRRWCRWRR